jgi:isoquinoline 1-oxidoreductase alpha subunit
LDESSFAIKGLSMSTMSLQINGKSASVEAVPSTPLLWVIRDELKLTGTKFGCGIAQCGACTVHVDGQPTRSCVTPISAVADKKITTIEGLSPTGEHKLQKAWVAEQVPQCGYCQSGMLMAAAALLEKTPQPTDAQIDEAMSNICRCGTYQRVRTAIRRAAGIEVAIPAKANV